MLLAHHAVGADKSFLDAYASLIKPVIEEQRELSSTPQGEALLKAQIAIVFGPVFYAKCYGMLPTSIDEQFNVEICNTKTGTIMISVPENPYNLDRPTTFSHDFMNAQPGQLISGSYKAQNGAHMIWVAMLSDELDIAELSKLEEIRMQEGSLALYACPEPGSGYYPGGDPGTLPRGNPRSIKYFFVHYMFKDDLMPNQLH